MGNPSCEIYLIYAVVNRDDNDFDCDYEDGTIKFSIYLRDCLKHMTSYTE